MGFAHAPSPWVGGWTTDSYGRPVWVDSPAAPPPRVPWVWLAPLGLILVGGLLLAGGVVRRIA